MATSSCDIRVKIIFFQPSSEQLLHDGDEEVSIRLEKIGVFKAKHGIEDKTKQQNVIVRVLKALICPWRKLNSSRKSNAVYCDSTVVTDMSKDTAEDQVPPDNHPAVMHMPSFSSTSSSAFINILNTIIDSVVLEEEGIVLSPSRQEEDSHPRLSARNLLSIREASCRSTIHSILHQVSEPSEIGESLVSFDDGHSMVSQ